MAIKKFTDELAKKREAKRKEAFNVSPENYTMAEIYDAEKLVVGKLEYVSSEVTEFGPMVEITSQNYIFKPIDVNGTVKYQEVFTGYIAGDSDEGYFDLPYVVDIKRLTEISVGYRRKNIPKLGMLLALNAVNSEMVKCDDRNMLNKRKTK